MILWWVRIFNDFEVNSEDTLPGMTSLHIADDFYRQQVKRAFGFSDWVCSLTLHTVWSVCTRTSTLNRSQSRPSRASPRHIGPQAVILESRSSLRVILLYVTCRSPRCASGAAKRHLVIRMGRRFSTTYLSTSNPVNAWVLVSAYSRIAGGSY